MGGVQAQYAPSTYVGLWSRVADFRRGQLDRALARRAVVQATLLRATIHVASAADYWLLSDAVRQQRLSSYLRTQRDGPALAEVETAAARVAAAMGDGS